MTKEQRKKHMHKVAIMQLKADESPGEHVSGSPSSEQLSISAEEFQHGLKIPLAAVQAIWRKAEELAGNSNAISPAPGYDSTCKMVMSRNRKCPHLVTSSTKGKYTCDSDSPVYGYLFTLGCYCAYQWLSKSSAACTGRGSVHQVYLNLFLVDKSA